MEDDYSLVFSSSCIKIKTIWAAIALTLLEAFGSYQYLSIFAGLESIVLSGLIIIDLIGAVLFVAALLLKNPWILIPQLLVYVLYGAHYIVLGIYQLLVALFPDEYGPNFWPDHDYEMSLLSDGYKQQLVQLAYSMVLKYVSIFVINLLIIVLVYRLFMYLRKQEKDRKNIAPMSVEPMIEL